MFAAAVALRFAGPQMERPFRIPVSSAGMVAVAGVPTAVALVFLIANGTATLAWGAAAAASGPLADPWMTKR